LKPLIANGVDLRRLILVTDSMTPDDVAERGHMDNVVRRAIALGLSPLQAIQMVTLNPAVYAGVEQDIGGIAPGRYADLALIDDLEPCHVDRVFVGGKVVARNGASLVDENPVAVPGNFFHSLSITGNASVQTFRIPCAAPRAKIRVMELLNQTITAERIMELSTPRGCVEADLESDLLKIAMFDRHRDAPVAFGFLKGFGVRVGAVGLTANLDENTLMMSAVMTRIWGYARTRSLNAAAGSPCAIAVRFWRNSIYLAVEFSRSNRGVKSDANCAGYSVACANTAPISPSRFARLSSCPL